MRNTFTNLASRKSSNAARTTFAAATAPTVTRTLPDTKALTVWQQAILAAQGQTTQAPRLTEEAKEAFEQAAEIAKAAVANANPQQFHEGDVSSPEWGNALAEYKPAKSLTVADIFAERGQKLRSRRAVEEAMESVLAEMSARDKKYIKDWENAENRVSFVHRESASRTVDEIKVLGEDFFSAGTTMPHDLRVSTSIGRGSEIEFFKYQGPVLLFTPKSLSEDVAVHLVSETQVELAAKNGTKPAAVSVKGFNDKKYSIVLTDGDVIGLPKGSSLARSRITPVSHSGICAAKSFDSCFAQLPAGSVELTGITRRAEDVQLKGQHQVLS